MDTASAITDEVRGAEGVLCLPDQQVASFGITT